MTHLIYTSINAECLVRCKANRLLSLHYLQSFAHLRVLDVSSTEGITDDVVMDIVDACPRLTHLDLSQEQAGGGDAVVQHRLTDTCGVIIARKLAELRTLIVNGCDFGDGLLLELAAHRANTLETLYTGECIRMTGEGYNTVLGKCLRLRGFEFDADGVSRLDLDMSLLGKLTTLRLNWSGEQESSFFSRIVHASCNLSYFRIHYPVYNDLDFDVLLHHLPCLRELAVLNGQLWNIDKKRKHSTHHRVADLLKAQRPYIRIYRDWDRVSYDVMAMPL